MVDEQPLSPSQRKMKSRRSAIFERYTDRARRVIVLAQEEAHQFQHNYIGTEHLLLGCISEGEGIAARALTAMGISLEQTRGHLERIIGHGSSPQTGQPPYTPRAKKVLELSLREALRLGHNYIGTEHILLGLIREGEGVAAQTLVKFGLDLEAARQQVVELIQSCAGKSAETGYVQQLLEGELRVLNSKIAASEKELTQLHTAHAEVTSALGRWLRPPGNKAES